MVPEKEIMPVRIKFSKTGDLMYISHLDLSRTMQRIMVRAGVDIWYSEGFNPQPRIVFALPLPVGVESQCELMDIKINKPMAFDEIKERIQSNFPDGMRVIDVYAPAVKFKNICFADYTIKLFSPKFNSYSCEEINNLFSKECVITKRSKSGEKEVDIRDFIKKITAESRDDYVEINAIISAGNENNLNPELIVEAIRTKLNLLNSGEIDEYCTIMRNRMLDEQLNDVI